jgi:hypothetical protein
VRTADRTFAHPWVLAGVAATGLVLSLAVALLRPVPAWELSLTRWVNAAPDAVATALDPIMQLGTLWAPFVVALVILAVRRDLTMAGAAMFAGLGAWQAARLVKALVERERPAALDDGIVVRDAADGFG